MILLRLIFLFFSFDVILTSYSDNTYVRGRCPKERRTAIYSCNLRRLSADASMLLSTSSHAQRLSERSTFSHWQQHPQFCLTIGI